MLPAVLRPPAQHVCWQRSRQNSSLILGRTLLVRRRPATWDPVRRRVTRLDDGKSCQVISNGIGFANGYWWGRGSRIQLGIQLGIAWRRWMSTGAAGAVYEDMVIGHGRGGLVMGVRVFRNPPKSKKSSPASTIRLIIFYPSGLPVYIPPSDQQSKGDIGPLILTENDHKIAAMLAEASKHTVMVPGYFVGSKHIHEQLYPRKKEEEDEDEGGRRRRRRKARDVSKEDRYKNFEEDFGDVGDPTEDIPKAAAVKEDAKNQNKGDGSGWVYPYPKHPIAGHLAVKAYDYILQNLPTLLSLPPGQIPPEVSLSMSGSLIGAGLASSIALSEFKHPPFITGVQVKTTTWIPMPEVEGETKKQLELTVELKSLALVTPLVNWCFEPLGGYDFGAAAQGTGEGWLLPPVPPLPEPHLEDQNTTTPEGGPYLLPAPTLPTLLRLRSAYFRTPEDYIDPYASPLFFLQTPGLDVGKDALARLWVSLRQETWLSGVVERVILVKEGKTIQETRSIDIITIEGTKRRTVGRRWPPAWGKLQLGKGADTRRGGLPQKGRIRAIVPGEGGEVKDGSDCIWGDDFLKKKAPSAESLNLTPATKWPSSSTTTTPPTPPLSSANLMAELPKQHEVIAEHAEYAQDHTSVTDYAHSARTISLLKNPALLLSRLNSAPISTRAAGNWLVNSAGDFVEGVERAWRSVVSADRNLRRMLEMEKEEKERARLAKKREIEGSRGFLVRDRRREELEKILEKERKRKRAEMKEEEEEEGEGEEELSLLEVIGKSEVSEGVRARKQRLALEENAVMRLGRWVKQVEKLP